MLGHAALRHMTGNVPHINILHYIYTRALSLSHIIPLLAQYHYFAYLSNSTLHSAYVSLSLEAYAHYYHVKEYIQVSWPKVRGEGLRSLHIKDHR